jgi:hypothetical protein
MMPSMMQQPTGMMQQHPTGMMTGQAIYQQQQQQQLQPQATGRNWSISTPDNPFGSSSPTPLNAQVTGVQFSTPNANVFTQSPQSSPAYLQQLQPQMTGIQQTELSGARDKYAAFRTPNADVFTPSGSMQRKSLSSALSMTDSHSSFLDGQAGFPQQQGYRGW